MYRFQRKFMKDGSSVWMICRNKRKKNFSNNDANIYCYWTEEKAKKVNWYQRTKRKERKGDIEEGREKERHGETKLTLGSKSPSKIFTRLFIMLKNLLVHALLFHNLLSWQLCWWHSCPTFVVTIVALICAVRFFCRDSSQHILFITRFVSIHTQTRIQPPSDVYKC